MMKTFKCQCQTVNIVHIFDNCLAFAKQSNVGYYRFIQNLDVSNQMLILMLVCLIKPADTVPA
jgi:hypothetical protein